MLTPLKPNRATLSTTAKAAPELTPKMPGSAKGLRVRHCISAPARPSAAPTLRPIKVRGTRSCHTTVAALASCECCSGCAPWAGKLTVSGPSRKTCHTKSGSKTLEPTNRLKTMAPAKASSASVKNIGLARRIFRLQAPGNCRRRPPRLTFRRQPRQRQPQQQRRQLDGGYAAAPRR